MAHHQCHIDNTQSFFTPAAHFLFFFFVLDAWRICEQKNKANVGRDKEKALTENVWAKLISNQPCLSKGVGGVFERERG